MKQKTSRLSKYAACILILLFLTNCIREHDSRLVNGSVSIHGNIENSKIKNGMLLHYDALNKREHPKTFEIDSIGNFNVSLDLHHETLNTGILQVGGQANYLFLEPGIKLQLTIRNDSIIFLSESGLTNRQLALLDDTLHRKFSRENDYLEDLKKDPTNFEEYIQEKERINREKVTFINAWSEENPLSPKVSNALQNDLHYAIAIERLRHLVKQSPHNNAGEKPLRKYEELFNQYNVNNINAVASKNFIGYLSNIKTIYSRMETSGTLSDFVKQAYPFSHEEIHLIDGYFTKDPEILASEDFKIFRNAGFYNILFEYRNRYFANNLLKNCEELPAGIGRDLIISQGLNDFYFKNKHIAPTEEEWLRINDLVGSDFIRQYLHQRNERFLAEQVKTKNLSGISEDVKVYPGSFGSKSLEKYKGNVVYLDFYSTWCIPCRREVPYSKKLTKHFANEEVVFVYVCCASEKNNWRKLVNEHKLKGEHYFLDEQDYDKVAALYGVRGFPTYGLIDKKGNLVTTNAPKPAAGSVIIEKIRELLSDQNNMTKKEISDRY